jgi:hypothetical protein
MGVRGWDYGPSIRLRQAFTSTEWDTTEEFYFVNSWFAKLVVPPAIKYEIPYELILLYKAGKGNAGGFVLQILDDPILYF